MNTFQTNFGAMKTKRWLVGGLWIPMVAALVALSVAGPLARAADTPPPQPVSTPLGYTQAQLAMKIATLLGLSFTDATDAMTKLKNHVPPAVPIGGWNPDQPATLGDLDVCFCQLLGISPSTAPGQSATAQDYQNALTSFGFSTPGLTLAALNGAIANWTAAGLNPFGPPAGGTTPIRTQTGPP